MAISIFETTFATVHRTNLSKQRSHAAQEHAITLAVCNRISYHHAQDTGSTGFNQQSRFLNIEKLPEQDNEARKKGKNYDRPYYMSTLNFYNPLHEL